MSRHRWPGHTAAERDDARRRFVLASIAALEPHLDPAVAAGIVTQHAAQGRNLSLLASWLQRGAGWCSPGSDVPCPTIPIAAGLAAAGAQHIHPMACTECGGTAALRHHRGCGALLCSSCLRAHRSEQCSVCGKTTRKPARSGDGAPLCQACAVKNPTRWEDCIGCGHRRRVNARTPTGPLCGACDRRRREATRQAARDAALVTAIAAIVDDVDPATIRQVAFTALPTVFGRNRAGRYVTAHPGCFGDGGSRVSPALAGLIGALHAHGSTRVQLPRCARCEKPVPLTRRRSNGDGLCGPCHRLESAQACAGCGRVKPAHKRLPAGGVLCDRCARPDQPCGVCGQTAPIADHDRDGRPRCSRCRRADPSNRQHCVLCGKDTTRYRRLPDGTYTCESCYTPPESLCSLCHQTRPIYAHVRGLAICTTCYRGRWHTCEICEAQDWCQLAAQTLRCRRCLLALRVAELLTGPDGTVAAQWIPLHDLLTNVPVPTTTLRWLRRSPAVKVLRQTVTGQVPLTHDALTSWAGDDPGRAAAIDHLRALLIATGLLPPHDRHLDRLERAIQQAIMDLPDDQKRLVQRFTRWQLMPRVRRASQAGRDTSGTARAVLGDVRTVIGFLTWLDTNGLTLATLTQHALDRWAAGKAYPRTAIRGFLTWTSARGCSTQLDLPPRSHDSTMRRLDEGTAVRLARQALHDVSWSVGDRVIAALILLYGQPLGRIRHLTTSHVATDAAGTVRLQLGRTPIEMPPPLGGLVRQLPDNPREGMAAAAPDESAWLFPGSRPGQPLSSHQLHDRMRSHGITPSAGANTAMARLAERVPATVLADLLGVTVTCAQRWSELVGATYAAYPQAVSIDRR